MRILYVTSAFQHPLLRGPTRCYYFLKSLSQRHAVTLLTAGAPNTQPEALQDVRSMVERLELVPAALPVSPLWRPWGARLRQYARTQAVVTEMRARFHRLVAEGFDVVLFHGKPVFGVIEGFRQLPLVIDFCDATSLRLRSHRNYSGLGRRCWLSLRERQVRRMERRMISMTPHLAFISARDRDAVMPAGSQANVIPIGVDCNYWKPVSEPATTATLAFSGVLDYAPNHDAAAFLLQRVVPLVQHHTPGLQTLILGRNPRPQLVRLAQAVRGVTITGFVPDLRPLLGQAAIAAVPVRCGAGVQNKALEAMAMELPVVATTLAADGLRTPAGEPAPVLVADDEVGFARLITHLLRNPEMRLRLGKAGRKFVQRHFVWENSACQLEQLCFQAWRSAAHPQRSEVAGECLVDL
jgi:glycosyltransferase involved in cell wall biosynthesis